MDEAKKDQLKAEHAHLRDELLREHARLQHAVQTGYAYSEPEKYGGEPGTVSNEMKHLRVGVTTALVDLGSLGRLLIAKGVIQEEEYLTALVEGMRVEKERLEAAMTAQVGRPVTLG